MPSPAPDARLDQETRDQLSRLRDGCVLLARDNLQDPNFAAAVVLMCAHGADGGYGLVMNRPAHMPLCEVFDLDTPARNETRKVYMGGPVQQETLQILQFTKSPVSSAHKVASDVHIGGDWVTLDQILGADPKITRLFLGYAGWGLGQLEAEITQGAWEVFAPDLSRFFLLPDDLLVNSSLDEKRDLLKSIR